MSPDLTIKPPCSGLILTEDGTVYDHDPATCRCHGAWIEPTVLKGGWENIDKYSLAAPVQLCEMCHKEHVAHVHVMRHPRTGEIRRCGCICSGHMQIGFEGMSPEQALASAVAREKELKADDTKIMTKRKRLAAERDAHEAEVEELKKRVAAFDEEVKNRVTSLFTPLKRKITEQQLALDKQQKEIADARSVLVAERLTHDEGVRQQITKNQQEVTRQLAEARKQIMDQCRFRPTASGWMITHRKATFFLAVKRDEYRLVPVHNGKFDNDNTFYFEADDYTDAKSKAVELIDAWINNAA